MVHWEEHFGIVQDLLWDWGEGQSWEKERIKVDQ